MMHTKYK